MESRGLTLVELLVVMAVMALLSGFLFPAFRSSREHARATTCGANIRQLLIELHAYEAENHSLPYGFDGLRKSPPPGGYPGNAMVDVQGWRWFNYIGAVRYRSAGDLKLLRCPSKCLDDPRLKPDILCGNYGVNLSLCKIAGRACDDALTGTPLSTSSMSNPGSTLLLVDSGYSTVAWWHAAREPPVTFGKSIQDAAYIPGLEINKDRTLWAGQTRDATGGRHPAKTVNIGFADGHVGRNKAETLLVERIDPNDWNCRPLWSPK